MDTQLYLRVRGRVLGPYDQEKLQSLVRRGQLSRMHEVSTDGTHWVRASTYAELFVGAPVKLVAPEMAVGSPPPPQQAGVASGGYSVEEAESPSPASAPPPVPPQAGRRWYYENAGAECGPVEEAELRQLLATGQIGRDSVVWHDGMSQWVAATQVPGLISAAVLPVAVRHEVDSPRDADVLAESLCKVASASRPWVGFLTITAFVYAGLCLLIGLFALVGGADRGIPPMVAMGLFWIIDSAVVAAGGILLANYSSRLSSLGYGKSSKVLENALDRLRVFWMYVSIVLIVILAFLVFFAIWVFAVGVSVARWA